MVNCIVVNYLFKVVRRHWLSFHYYLDPLDRLSKISSKDQKARNKNSDQLPITTEGDLKINRKKSSIAPSKNTPTIINNNSSRACRKWDLTFLYPIIHMTFCSLYGNIYLVYAAQKEDFIKNKHQEAAFEFEWSLESLFANPYMLFHQVFPRLMWHQSDVCDTIGIVGAIAIYCSFLRNPAPRSVKYRFAEGKAYTILTIGRSELSEADSTAILAYHRRLHPPAMACLLFFILATLGFSYLNVFYVHRLFRVIFRDLFLWFAVYPLHVCYVLYAIFALIHFPIMTSKFLQIRQKSLLGRLTALAEQLTSITFGGSNFERSSSSPEIPPSPPPPFYHRKQQQMEHIWRQIVLLNRAYAVLCTDIATASRFWSPFLSIFLLEHITLQAYMAYIVFIIRTLPFTQKLFFLYALIEVEALLFLLINRCAKIVKLNKKVERVNAKVYLKLFTRNLGSGKRDNKMVHRVILKAEWLQMKDRLKPYCMVLMDNYRITSKTFYMVISYIAVFFLMVFKNQ